MQRANPGLSPAKPALIGVSGGRDSAALLHCLVSRGWERLVVCHLNHGLRGGESDADASFVRKLARELSLKCEIEKQDAAAVAKRKKISIELAGRELRTDFFRRMAAKHGCAFVFLAHHADDQAETVIGNLFRGSGLHGAAGMEAVSEGGSRGVQLLRPLIKTRRREIDDYIAERRLPFREDSSNLLPVHRRNRIRHEVIPLLNDVFGRDIVPVINRFAELARRDDESLREISSSLEQMFDWIQSDGSLRISPAFQALGPALQSRLLIWMLDSHGVPATHVLIESALSMFSPGGPAKVNLPGGGHLRRKAKRLWIESR